MDATGVKGSRGVFLALISVHGLIRGSDLELGRDADTGGQTTYVVELAKALGGQSGVRRVVLITRLVRDPAVADDYAQSVETIADNVTIVRIEAGPDQYLPKEALWDHLDTFADNTRTWLQEQPHSPDLLHSHYADAGYAGSLLSRQLGIPLVHTGHSLGRVKRRRLLAAGLDAPTIEQRYNMARRIEAEETTLASAERVITSTYQEIEAQYGLYDHYQPEQMQVIPPGTDLLRFHPPDGSEWQSAMAEELRRFLREPEKPLILALSRPDARKNIASLLIAYGKSPDLQACANLVIVAGNREDISDLDSGAREVLTDILYLIDRHNLYGKVAYPKHHAPEEVPLLYRLATASGGVFINPALTEPFGLTLIEAAASGLPIVATEDGGPRDIVANCQNGLLVNPLDHESIADALLEILSDWEGWQERSVEGLRGVREHYSWQAHAANYLNLIRPVIDKTEPLVRPPATRRPMLYHDRAIFSDLDQNLLGDLDALPEFIRLMRTNRKCATFGIATGRRLDSALKIMRRHAIPEPDLLITSGGTEIYYAPELTRDNAWTRHIDHHWSPHLVRRALREVPGLKLQSKHEQSHFKISYYIDAERAPSIEEINALLHKEELSVNVVHAFGQFLDVLPIRASKGLALRYVAARWGIPLERVLVAGGSGADEDMMRGNTLAVVVGNRHNEELAALLDTENIYLARQPGALGIVEAIEHYDFFRSCTVPERHEQPEGT
ncbi:MAG: HAD family hydrolase [Candidatus Sedimenticola endophacoides]|uniref:sucrose-phosphate synthase n=2 Tax=Candidatus Sedimenticola endophacoides TaxID=2548426 RepID=A0A6N4E2E6_9GAMM|nr:MAG: HAD family hydrolase [Candidatus Sedimenticola endophacoides]OQX42039.1 MAG: HAD family hydrolase [Candidatus Sedimenticola endophacoides]OQX42506.1 MAG: HAD family hydrolase [Candidatus Sedimenticola endophacoides]PUD98641.1 MAG: HAD family hydrolase [Candidatus Sedimenticola endophacoides]PUE01826.1 MAG: HAD family hydrolase [Candidatus Sedimenticola endophacoides]